jgi:xanthine dehydrogenase small subunit
MKFIKFILNGEQVSTGVGEQELLLHTLRERFGLKSVKEGCGIGECGTCTVLIDDEACYSCLTLASRIDGHDVKTVEFLSEAGALHPLQEAFIKYGAVQCGYCTPGMLLSAYSLLLKNREPDRETIKEAISGNLCRCTGYVQIEEAIGQAARTVAGCRSPDKDWPGQLQVAGSQSPGRSSGTVSAISPEACTASSELRIQNSKERVLKSLTEHDGVLVIAGGTDLLVALRKGEIEGPLADISDVAELKSIEHEQGLIRIGAAMSHAKIGADETVKNLAKSLSLACGWVGSPQIRNMGTIGGNLVNASPAADSLAPLLIHDAVVTLESLMPPVPPLEKRNPGGLIRQRQVKLEDFIVAPYKTVINKNELLTSVTLKALPGYREGYRRVTKRATWAIARLSVAWAVQEREGIFNDVRLAIGSCTPMPFRPAKVEAFLKGNKKTDATIDRAIEMVIDEIKQITGMRPSFTYKIPVLKGILQAALRGQ